MIRDPRKLTTREKFFIQAYLGEARGNGARAARMAGYAPAYADREASRLLRRQRVRDAIDRALRVQAEREGLDKPRLVGHLVEVLRQDRPFERVKAIELLARLLGYFAPSRGVVERVEYEGGSYAELARTLEEHAGSFTPEQRACIRKRVLEDIEAAQRCLAILDRFTGRDTVEH
jgi:hypothetical protein